MSTLTLQQTLPAPGIYRGVAETDYHAWPAASASRLNRLYRSALHLRHEMRAPPESTPAQVLGSALHTAVLEPERFRDLYVAEPKIDKRTKAGKEAYAAFITEHVAKRHLKEYEMAEVEAMREAVLAHPDARALLESPAEPEQSVVWRDEATGVECKARIDQPAPQRGTLVDLKTTRDASPEGFGRSLWNYGYFRQAAFYRAAMAAHGKDFERFTFVCVEKGAPYAVGVYTVEEEVLHAGAMQITDLLERWAECHATDTWPGYASGTVSLPRWAWAQLQEG